MAPLATYWIVVSVLAALAAVSSSHGLLSSPRVRGALKSDYSNLNPKTIDESAEQDLCAVCQNGGGLGVVVGGGREFSPYAPLEGNFRPSIGICGDHSGLDDHMKSGRFANPESTPFVKEWTPGSVVNLEFYITAHHGGYLEMYLCDVTSNPGQDIQKETFGDDCHKLMREPDEGCESGRDTECGPIDPRFPGRWVLPCSNPAPGGGQVFGGENGKMAYRLPDVEMEVAVLHSYWATANTCTPDAFMLDYNYPEAWGQCGGDGGSIGGKPQHQTCQEGSRFPEEFWGCSDVTVRLSGSDDGNNGNGGESQSNEPATDGGASDGSPEDETPLVSSESNDGWNAAEGGDSAAHNGGAGSGNTGDAGSSEGGESGGDTGDGGADDSEHAGSPEGEDSNAQDGESGTHNSGDAGSSGHGSGAEGEAGDSEAFANNGGSSQQSNLHLRVYEAGVPNDQSKEGPVLSDGMTFCPRGEFENMTLRCVGVNQEIVHTVTFFVNDKIVWIEGVAPYAIAGDSDSKGIAERWEDVPEGEATISCVTDYGDSASATVNFAC